MTSFLRPIILLLASSAISLAASEGWTSDIEAAKTRAKTEDKPMFLYFTDADLKTIMETEYREGGPEKYVAHLKQLLEKASKPAETKAE